MDVNNLSSIITLLIALSVASERLVEIIKGFSKYLNEEKTDPAQEGRRKSILQILAVIAGIATAFLASPALPASVIPDSWFSKFALGLLASGGSGFWNSIQSYVTKAKEVKKVEVDVKKAEVDIKKAEADVKRI